jgi:hypothetical protein
MAQDCTPGQPCDTPLTEDDPATPEIEPNEPDAPNYPKNSYGASCDSDVMNQMYAKAYLQAERQNMLAQAVMRKPDSVLEYSCFDQIASLTATVAAGIFSENQTWRKYGVPITTGSNTEATGEINTENVDTVAPVRLNTYMPTDRMDQAINNLVLESMENYYRNNYWHNFLGGEMRGIDAPLLVRLSTDAYNCGRMNTIYNWAKCDQLDNAEDAFYDFEYLTQTDPRAFPQTCDAIPERMNQGTIDIANNEDFVYASFQKLENAYFERLTGDECSEPIPTGVTVYIKDIRFDEQGKRIPGADPTPFEEHFCTNPGCYYNQGACVKE